MISVLPVMRSLLISLAVTGSFVCASPSPASAQAAPSDWFSLVTLGKCVEVHGTDVGLDGARVQIWGCHGGPNQLWRYESNGTLISASGGCLEIHGGELGRDGARVQMWPCHGGANQQWQLGSDGSLRNSAGGCLDLQGWRTVDGARFVGWTCNGKDNQRFALRGDTALPAPPPVVAPPVVAPPAVAPPVVAPPARGPHPHPGGRAGGALVPDEAAFGALFERVNRASFSTDKLSQIELASRSSGFRADQIKRLLGALAFSQDKMRALGLLAPRLVDPQNGGLILEAFPFSSDRERAVQILSRL